MPLAQLVEARNKYNAKSEILAKVKEEAKDGDGNLDLTKVECLGDAFKGKDLVGQVEHLRELEKEVAGLYDEFKKLDISDLEGAAKLRGVQTATMDRMVHGAETKSIPEHLQRKSIGSWVAKSEDPEESEFAKMCKRFLESGKQAQSIKLDAYPSQIEEWGFKSIFPMVKADFTQAAGWDPEAIRQPGWVDAPSRPPNVVETIPSGRTGTDTIKYMLETTRTHSAAEKAAGAAYAESSFVLTETTQAVEKITDSVPTFDEVLADVNQAETYLRSRLGFGVRQKLDSQLLVGSGASNQLLGANNVAGINTQARGTMPNQDAIFRGMTKIRVNGFAEPSVVYIHPNNWQVIRLQTANGQYLFGPPSVAAPDRIWGVPVVQTTAQTANTALVSDNSPVMCMFFERAGVEVQIGFVNDDFTKGRQTLRAQMRGAMVWFRALAISTVTGLEA